MAFVSLDNARKKSKATRIVADFKQIEKALYLLKDQENPAKWWREGDKGGGPLSAFTGLSKFINITNPPITGSYYYDNNGDTVIEGEVACCKGVNIYVNACGSFCQPYFDLVDNIVDKGDGRYNGKIRNDGSYTYLIYNLAFDENIN